jgi:FKBP-type peptidyl-prolyl cis-trans isomerase|tara:strand:+ start:8286 stop:8990 length:705 start_codon:yes stop_codon:yes gene_type:complete
MKFTYYLRAAVAMLVLVSTMPSCSQAQPSQTSKLSTQMDSVSYALGVLFATNMKSEGMTEISSEALASGFTAVMNDNATIDPTEADAIVREAMTAAKEKASAVDKAEGENFLAENAKKDGISVTESGLQYNHETVGTGESPTASDKVTVHYKGTLLDGTEFDSSYKRGEPISFPLNGVIPGWTEGLQLMKVGGKTTFYIPQDLAYGARPNPGGPIPPFAALIFEVELIEIESAE